MKNIAKKIGMMLLTMVIVSFFAFLAFQVIPGDPTTKLLGNKDEKSSSMWYNEFTTNH